MTVDTMLVMMVRIGSSKCDLKDEVAQADSGAVVIASRDLLKKIIRGFGELEVNSLSITVGLFVLFLKEGFPLDYTEDLD